MLEWGLPGINLYDSKITSTRNLAGINSGVESKLHQNAIHTDKKTIFLNTIFRYLISFLTLLMDI